MRYTSTYTHGTGRWIGRRAGVTMVSARTQVLEAPERGVLARVIEAELVVDAEHARRREDAVLDDEPFGEDELRVHFRLGDGIADRLELELDDIADRRARAVLREIDLERRGNRRRQVVGLDEQSPRAAQLAAEHARERGMLRVAGAGVDVAGRAAAAFVDRAGPFREHRRAEPAERDVAGVAAGAINPDPAALAEPFRGSRVDVARAAPVTVARDQDVAAQTKCHRHSLLRAIMPE